MSAVVQADILGTIHLAFVAFVVIAQVLVMLVGGFPVRWVRNFWFRAIHLLCIGIVAAEGMAGVECPLTSWERNLRREARIAADRREQRPNEDDPDYKGDYLYDHTDASLIGRTANSILFYRVANEDQVKMFVWGHITFAGVVLITFFLVPPRWPWRKKKQASAPASAAPPVPASNGSVREREPAGVTGVSLAR